MSTPVKEETLEEVAERIVTAEFYSVSPEQAKATDLYAAILSALRSEREACAKAICNLCRRPEDYQSARRGEDGTWRHARVNQENEWEEVCAATTIRERTE